MAQVILSALLARRGIQADIASAGLLPGGQAMPTETQDALEALGFGDPGLHAFRSHQVTSEAVANADLIVGLARDHVREVVVRDSIAWTKTFTLKELVRLGEAVGPRNDDGLSDWLARAAGDRDRMELLGSSVIDDVSDPIGGPPSRFEKTAREIHALCESLSRLVWR
jgi:protein-tyrosine phosphatase